MRTSHQLLEFNEASRTGICEQCGPVRINKAGSYKGIQYWKCQHYDLKYQGREGGTVSPQHRLSAIDESKQIARCLICGPVSIIRSGSHDGRINWRCRIASGATSPTVRKSKAHVLSDLRPDEPSAICKKCGPVIPLRAGRRSGIQRWICPGGVQAKPKSTEHSKQHILSSIDADEKTAICKKCGPTSIVGRGVVNGKQYWKCLTAYRWIRLEQKYGLSEDSYNAMYQDQKGKCSICEKEQIVLCVDHDHKTLRVRSLLCGHCNAGLGQFRDRPDLLQNAIHYLELHAA